MKTYCFKLINNQRKFNYLRRLLKIANEIYNSELETKKAAYNKDKTIISKFDLQKLNAKKKETKEFSHWKILNSTAIQQISDRIDLAYQKFFKNLKSSNKKKVSPPKFKPLRKQQSITFKQCGYKLYQKDSKIKIGKHYFRYHNSREVKGNIKTLTVKKNRLGEFFIFITTDYSEKIQSDKARSGNSVGFDFGLKTFLTASSGSQDDIIAPEFFKQDLKNIQKLSKQLSSKQKGSSNRRKARRKLAKAHLNITNKRNDFQWKTALYLVKNYETICLEMLNIKAMQRLWGRKISDLAFYSFLQKLKYLAEIYNCKLIFVDRWFASSKTCSNCNHKNDELSLDQRKWECQNCHTILDRDRNAAINIKNEGLKSLNKVKEVGTSTLAGVDIRPLATKAVGDDSRIL